MLLNPLELLTQYTASLVVTALWWHIFATGNNQGIEWSMLPALWDKPATFSFQSHQRPWLLIFLTDGLEIGSSKMQHKILKSPKGTSPRLRGKRIRQSRGWDFQCDLFGAQLPPDYVELGTICPAFMSLNVKEPKANKPPCETEREWLILPSLV